MPQRRIPSTGEMLPVIGLGSSKVVSEIAAKGEAPLAGVLRTLVEHGGKLVDTWPRNADNDAGFGRVASAPDLRDKLFVTTKIDQAGKEAGIAQFRADAAQLPAAKARSRADFQLDGPRRALADPEGMEGRGRYALHRRHRRGGRALRAARAIPAAREAGLRADELLDHRARYGEPAAAARGGPRCSPC